MLNIIINRLKVNMLEKNNSDTKKVTEIISKFYFTLIKIAIAKNIIITPTVISIIFSMFWIVCFVSASVLTVLTVALEWLCALCGVVDAKLVLSSLSVVELVLLFEFTDEVFVSSPKVFDELEVLIELDVTVLDDAVLELVVEFDVVDALDELEAFDTTELLLEFPVVEDELVVWITFAAYTLFIDKHNNKNIINKIFLKFVIFILLNLLYITWILHIIIIS